MSQQQMWDEVMCAIWNFSVLFASLYAILGQNRSTWWLLAPLLLMTTPVKEEAKK